MFKLPWSGRWQCCRGASGNFAVGRTVGQYNCPARKVHLPVVCASSRVFPRWSGNGHAHSYHSSRSPLFISSVIFLFFVSTILPHEAPFLATHQLFLHHHKRFPRSLGVTSAFTSHLLSPLLSQVTWCHLCIFTTSHFRGRAIDTRIILYHTSSRVRKFKA